MNAGIDAGSFRDPRGHIYIDDGRVFRTVTKSGLADFQQVRQTGLLDKLVDNNRLVAFEEADAAHLSFVPQDVDLVLEHPRLPFISYPYEWGFQLLKSAALLQLDIYAEALQHDVTLTDASAYNIQFVGSRPIFIDHLAFRPYRDGEFWTAHRQFCEQFLNPLLLRAKLGIVHNAWYRGALEGISTSDLNRLLPLRKKFSWNVFSQVVLQDKFQEASLDKSARATVSINKGLPKQSFERMLMSMRNWIEKLQPLDSGKTVWGGYAADNSYSGEGASQKRAFIADFARVVQPKLIWDIGCNTGEYSAAALEAGAASIIGFDFDQTAIDMAYQRAVDNDLQLLPLYLDAANPAPDQGWGERERKGLRGRAECDAILALALVHHLAIGKNVPLEAVVNWLLSLAPNGVIEFVPKSDPMVQELLRFRDDIFDKYTLENFERSIQATATIKRWDNVEGSERRLVWYRRKDI